ncbi:porphobilinogen synthase [Caloramator proteoclasticus]|uniref:Delta-aminolevulinic acid dehydratase n=1 Tax=Caloramator proteoclasticus DSM 10124 TaxID=1121262 RepID=A0A1M4S9L5_9CLOT|nr:porphobilinogen synthase [Caloramator proteoclasticus]SHE28891.1 porphobilinogen synthase [Caloramator proteoclasticus DSM 10124]
MFNRTRRTRINDNIRALIRETVLNIDDLIYPLFVVEGNGIVEEISSLEGNYRYSVDKLDEIIKEIERLGIRGVLIFGVPSFKDECGTSAYADDGIVQRAVRRIKEISNLFIITDVCMCQYTSHGHCGIIKDGYVDNDETLKFIAKIALSHARAGADMVAPSDMMDGRVKAIRNILDENGYKNVGIMSYSAKYASSFYGPFREAADSKPQFGDRKSYQMDFSNIREAMREIEYDIEEGADIVMVKPALSYLDVIRWTRDRFNHPIAAYNVSGEYAMVKAAAKMGYIDEEKIVFEILTSIKRAGADIIITYHALDVARKLNNR